jgi:hypothetical protein
MPEATDPGLKIAFMGFRQQCELPHDSWTVGHDTFRPSQIHLIFLREVLCGWSMWIGLASDVNLRTKIVPPVEDSELKVPQNNASHPL